MKKFIPLLTLTAAILTACPTPQPAGTAVPSTGGSVTSGDATFTAPSASAGTFVNVTSSSDQGSIPTGLFFTKAANFQVTAGSVANATVSFIIPGPVAVTPSQIQPTKGISSTYRLYRRDGNFWRYVDGQTYPNNTSVAAKVSSYGVYGVLQGVATIKDIVVTPNPLSITVGQTHQMTTVVRDSLNQPMPSVDSPITWGLRSTYLAGANLQPQAVAPVLANALSAEGLFTANVAGTDTIDVTTQQNKTIAVPVTISPLVK